MAKYEVNNVQTIAYAYEVEANNPSEAESKLEDFLAGSQNKDVISLDHDHTIESIFQCEGKI